VQRELIRIGLDKLIDLENDILNSKDSANLLLDKENIVTKYEIMLKAFNDQSENEIIDWESFSRFTNSEIIDYINAICILEETSIEDIILEFKNVDSDILTHENINLFEVIDTTLMTDKFLNKLLPQGDRSSEEDHGSRRVDHYDPIPYRIVAKRIFVEEIKPSRAYFLLLEGVKKGIKDLDFDTIIAYETSQLFEIRRNDKSLTTNKDLKELMSYDTSYERFSQLINQDEFLEVRLMYNLIAILPSSQPADTPDRRRQSISESLPPPLEGILRPQARLGVPADSC